MPNNPSHWVSISQPDLPITHVHIADKGHPAGENKVIDGPKHLLGATYSPPPPVEGKLTVTHHPPGFDPRDEGHAEVHINPEHLKPPPIAPYESAPIASSMGHGWAGHKLSQLRKYKDDPDPQLTVKVVGDVHPMAERFVRKGISMIPPASRALLKGAGFYPVLREDVPDPHTGGIWKTPTATVFGNSLHRTPSPAELKEKGEDAFFKTANGPVDFTRHGRSVVIHELSHALDVAHGQLLTCVHGTPVMKRSRFHDFRKLYAKYKAHPLLPSHAKDNKSELFAHIMTLYSLGQKRGKSEKMHPLHEIGSDLYNFADKVHGEVHALMHKDDTGEDIVKAATADPSKTKKRGAMVAFALPVKIAETLHQDGGEPANILHITLAFLGKAAEIGTAQQQSAIDIVRKYASQLPLKARILGSRVFPPSKNSDGKEVLYAAVDVIGGDKFRESLAKELEDAGLPVARNFDPWLPHITLKYRDPSRKAPTLEPSRFALDALIARFGDKEHKFYADGSYEGDNMIGKAAELEEDDIEKAAKHEDTPEKIAYEQKLNLDESRPVCSCGEWYVSHVPYRLNMRPTSTVWKASCNRCTKEKSNRRFRHPADTSCNKCNQIVPQGSLQLNHKDYDHSNNLDDNLEYLCHNCHEAASAINRRTMMSMVESQGNVTNANRAERHRLAAVESAAQWRDYVADPPAEPAIMNYPNDDGVKRRIVVKKQRAFKHGKPATCVGRKELNIMGCGKHFTYQEQIAIHHVTLDKKKNEPEDLGLLCQNCHDRETHEFGHNTPKAYLERAKQGRVGEKRVPLDHPLHRLNRDNPLGMARHSSSEMEMGDKQAAALLTKDFNTSLGLIPYNLQGSTPWRKRGKIGSESESGSDDDDDSSDDETEDERRERLERERGK